MGPVAVGYEYLGGRPAKRSGGRDLRGCGFVVCTSVSPADYRAGRATSAGALIQPDGHRSDASGVSGLVVAGRDRAIGESGAPADYRSCIAKTDPRARWYAPYRGSAAPRAARIP